MENKSDRTIDVLKITLSLITLSTPFVYLVGLGFYQGLLSGYGVSSSLFPLDFQGYLTNAYYFLVFLIFDVDNSYKTILIFFSIAGIVAIISLVLFVSELVLKKIMLFLRKKGLGLSEYESESKEDKSFYEIESSIAAFILVALIIFPLAASSLGKNVSYKKLEEYNDNGCVFREDKEDWGECIKILDKEKNAIVTEGLLIAVSEERVAVYSNNESQILPYLDNYIIVYRYNSGRNKQ